ncbi:unnamed protein product [Sphagnum balticum]
MGEFSESLSFLPVETPQLYGHKINIDNLISICSSKLTVNSSHKKALFIRASSYMKKKMYDEAIEDCHQLLNIDSRNCSNTSVSRQGGGSTRIGQEESSFAEISFSQELSRENSLRQADVYHNYGCLDKKGHPEEAVRNFSEAIRLDPSKADFYSNRGFTLRKLGRHK